MTHVCTVIGGDSRYQAVVCADLVTYEGASDYYVYAGAEAYCQATAAPHGVVACKLIEDAAGLYTGNGGGTVEAWANCLAGTSGSCPAARETAETRNWDHSIAAAGNGVCSSSANSAYQVWGLVLGNSDPGYAGTKIETPDQATPYKVQAPNTNDGANESTGHYLICP